MPDELFELRVIVEADGWRDVSTLIDTVDRALDAHRGNGPTGRRWSVIAERVDARRSDELAACVRLAETDGADRLTA